MWKLAAHDTYQGPVQMIKCSIIKKALRSTCPQGILDGFAWLVFFTVWKEMQGLNSCFPQCGIKGLFSFVLNDQIDRLTNVNAGCTRKHPSNRIADFLESSENKIICFMWLRMWTQLLSSFFYILSGKPSLPTITVGEERCAEDAFLGKNCFLQSRQGWSETEVYLWEIQK